MKKIPTLFVRDENDRRHVTPRVTPGCEWVLRGEGQALRKYDGTCLMLDSDGWWARREVKADKLPPPNFQPVETDDVTGKTVGWEPVGQSAFARWFEQAEVGASYKYGTYELVGPKVNGNPEKYDRHVLILHADAEVLADDFPAPRSYVEIESVVRWLAERGWEGIVYHHPDGRMAKIKARDFR